MNFRINYIIYPFDCMVFINEPHEKVVKVLSEYIDLTEEEKEDLVMEGQGRTVMFSGNQTVLQLRKLDYTPYRMGMMAHEVFHAVDFLMWRIGVKNEMRVSDEAYAYMIGFLTDSIIYNWKKNKKN